MKARPVVCKALDAVRRLLLWEDAADQAVPQEDLGGLLWGPGPDGGVFLVPGGVHVAL